MLTVGDILEAVARGEAPAPELVALAERESACHDRALDMFMDAHKAPPAESDLPELESLLAQARLLALN